MLTKNNFKKLLDILEYTKNENIYSKNFGYNCNISVDFNKEEIIYPDDLVVNDKTTSNFDKNENFVVFECVNKLLTKGYLSKNIELEPRWQLGRGASGGKADILIKDNNRNEFLIIECKTYGDEFDKNWQKTLSDGDQLFSYAQQIKKTQYLCMYASDLVDNDVIYKNKIVTLQDNMNYLKTLKPNKRLFYKDASDVKELYKVWKDIYNLEYEEIGIFEDKCVPYEINKKNYSIDDLNELAYEDSQKKYFEFATILRQHNVSGHENAFDKLVNLFLAKIVDEIDHSNNLKFNWRGVAYDDFYQLQDRLQKLYKDGMHKFLNEEVTYIDNNQITNAFKLFKNDPDATRDQVMEYFRKLKFYTNNDFAFIDVHNEELFRQNSEILLKMVKLFQDIKLKTDEQNQFLGNLFEGFLDDGVKQNEGQFFTPLPITRFIVSSLPLKDMYEDNDEIPKIIDYSCGAGHFLTEYATEIKKIIDDDYLQDNYSEIYGIEKEYRLSKVSKVSAFMYGQDNINIVYGDALSANPQIKDGTYSILIANPPYSVKGFLETLDEEDRNRYKLTKLVGKNAFSSNNSIEAFFVERASQLLKPGGIAGIILPTSILTNANAIYSATREIILQNFDIISIVELPKGTFGATGTPTIVLFIKKKEENPSITAHYKNRVNSWFSGDFNKDLVFEDKNLLIEYLELQKINYEDYFEFINGNINDNLKKNTIFKQYLSNNKLKNIKDILNIEKEKLYYFMLAKTQKNKVLLVNAPTDNEGIKEYLGYNWSKRNHKLEIKYIGDNSADEININKGINIINTPLFNPNDLEDVEKINTLVRNNFNSEELDVEYENAHYYNLIDLLDFKTDNFTKIIKTANIHRNIILKSGYNLYDFADSNNFSLNIGKRVLSNEVTENGKIPIYSANVNEIFGYTNDLLPSLKEFELPSILWGIDGDWNVNLIKKNNEFYPTDHCGVLRVKNSNLLPEYVMFALEYEGLKSRFSRNNRASTQRVKDLSIQAPNIKMQKEIVREIKIIDDKIKEEQKKVFLLENSIKNKFKEIFMENNYQTAKISSLATEIYAGGDTPKEISKTKKDEYIYPIFSNGTRKLGLLYYSKNYKTDKKALTISARGTIGYTQIREPNFTAVVRLIVLIPNEKVTIEYLKSAIDNLEISKTGNGAGQLTVPDFENMEIQVPPIELQNKFSEYVNNIYQELNADENIVTDLEKKKEDLMFKYFE